MEFTPAAQAANPPTWNQPCTGPCAGYGSHACCPPHIVLAVAAVESPATLATSTCLISLHRSVRNLARKQ